MNVIDKAVSIISPKTGLERITARKAIDVFNTGYSNHGANTFKKSVIGWFFRGGSVKQDVYKNRNNRCFIEVNRNIPYTKNNNVFGGSVVEYGKIGDYTGYLECDKIVLETNATNQEQEEIKNLLRNGVFI